MTKVQANTQGPPQPAAPGPALKHLDVLVGTWEMTGHTLDSEQENITGWNACEWLPGGFFLKSFGEINFNGAMVQSLEIIGYDPASKTFPSSVYSNLGGDVLTYSWDVQGSTVTHADESSKYTGTLSADGKTLSGGWRPKKGAKEIAENAYDAVMSRVK